MRCGGEGGFRTSAFPHRAAKERVRPARRCFPLVVGGDPAVADDERFAQQLGSPGYHINRSNKLVIEAKQEMQKRGLASPDDADALARTFARAGRAKATEPVHRAPKPLELNGRLGDPRQKRAMR